MRTSATTHTGRGSAELGARQAQVSRFYSPAGHVNPIMAWGGKLSPLTPPQPCPQFDTDADNTITYTGGSLMTTSRQSYPTITPSDLLSFMREVEQDTGLLVRYTWEVSHRKETLGKLCLACALVPPSIDAQTAPEYVSYITWPTSSHKSVLGAMYWLLLDVQSQADAGAFLAGG